MRFDAGGNLVIAESRNNRIQRFDRAGNHLETWGEAGAGPGQFDMPYGIHVDGEGNAFSLPIGATTGCRSFRRAASF